MLAGKDSLISLTKLLYSKKSYTIISTTLKELEAILFSLHKKSKIVAIWLVCYFKSGT